MENKEIFRKIDVILLEEQMKSTPTVAVLGASSDNDFIRFNSAPDTKPAYLEEESSMLDVNVFIEQATYYINTGLKISILKMAVTYIWQVWLQSLESKGMREMTLKEGMELIKRAQI